MVKKRNLSPRPVFDEKELREDFQAMGIKQIHVKKVLKYVASNPQTENVAQVQKALELPLKFDEKTTKFALTTSRVSQELHSNDGTVKLLIQLQDKHEVEAVIMKHNGRNTLCVSSQIGCQMACTFCATGTMGIIGDMTAGEILEQLVHALKIAPIRNIVFMGMGEPLMNYDNVLTAIRAMTEYFNIAPKHITLSTVGVIHRIRQLKEDAPLVRLALSLHAPTQELRSKIVPSSKAFPLDKLMASIDDHLLNRNRMVMIEYVMLAGVNDSLETAHTLGKLLYSKSVHVNLIPYNSTDVDAEYQSPPKSSIREFHAILRNEYNLKATVRENHGQDIDGACGQLAVKNISKKKKKGCSTEPTDIEDFGQKPNSNIQTRKTREDDSNLIRRIGNSISSNYFIPTGLLLLSVPIIVCSVHWCRRK